jgi:tripartite-type tricarboxylate transporter receptor subunit TctC
MSMVLAAMFAGCMRGQVDGSWPAKNINIIVAFKPGGGFDLQARLLAPFLQKYLPNKVNVVIENVDGAGGKMGAVRLARSAPDGYTIGIIGLESIAFMRAMGQLTEDPEQWNWLGQIGSDPLLVAVNARSGLNTPADMKRKDFRFAVTSEMLPSAAILTRTLGAKFRPVHFDGSGDIMLAGMRGDVDAIVFSWPTAIKGVRDSQGKLTSLFVVNHTRIPSIAEVPTLAELGVEAEAGVYAVTAVSRVMAAPAGLDSKVRETLVAAIEKAAHDTEFIAQMKQAEFEVVTAPPDAVRLKVKAAVEEFERARDTIDASVVGGISTGVFGR